MVQKIIAGIFKGVGIVPTLFILGVILILSGINSSLGNVLINSSVFIGIILGSLSVWGMVKKV